MAQDIGAQAQPFWQDNIKKINAEAPWDWLKAGWRDMQRTNGLSYAYGFLFAVAFAFMFIGLLELEMSALMLVLAAGFLIVGPMWAVGLYEGSRLIEADVEPSLSDILVVRVPSYLQIAYLGLLLAIIFLVWVRLAMLLYAIFFGLAGLPPLSEFVPNLLFTTDGILLLSIGSLVGGLMAFLVFTVSVVAAPMLASTRVDFMTAVITSMMVVRRNFWPMMLWAWLIVWFMVMGLITMGVGLIIAYPLIGHASWHAFRATVKSGRNQKA